MIDVDPGLVDWSRAQFALTAMYHWIFVPLTLGLSFLCAFYETIYLKTGNEQWKNITRFWMTLFGINFAIGVATGIILEFEFGTNWSNYSWMVGDIFGAPLAIEGIFAFFMEASFFAVMFFGWNRVSKGFHCFSTWMVAIGANLSAVWILVANGWMQNPVGMAFNPDKARFEMQNFAEVVFNPVAVSKFTHTSSSGFVMASAFVLTVSCWYLIKRKHIDMAKKSIVVASVFGLVASIFVAFTGDEHAYGVAQKQPMKLAAMEGLYKGERGAGLVAMGIVNSAKDPGDVQDAFLFEVKIPQLLSLLANRKLGSFVPGIDDLVFGNSSENVMGVNTMMEKGKLALADLAAFKKAKKNKNEQMAADALQRFDVNREFMGYGYLTTPEEAVPPVSTVFYNFHIMAVLGSLFPVIFGTFLFFSLKGQVTEKRWLLPVGLFSALLAFLAGQAGWITAEVGRQPWAIQGLMPVKVATTNLSVTSVQITFFMFAAVFTLLLIAEISIMLKQIAIGPEGH
ncbi:MAG: cytochrome ubiquinol oxidase subunit I [Desulfocapsa sp.]|nr:cytochrome ubiquinol oxidase subunit I [Desulfocapsa sp.]